MVVRRDFSDNVLSPARTIRAPLKHTTPTPGAVSAAVRSTAQHTLHTGLQTTAAETSDWNENFDYQSPQRISQAMASEAQQQQQLAAAAGPGGTGVLMSPSLYPNANLNQNLGNVNASALGQQFTTTGASVGGIGGYGSAAYVSPTGVFGNRQSMNGHVYQNTAGVGGSGGIRALDQLQQQQQQQVQPTWHAYHCSPVQVSLDAQRTGTGGYFSGGGGGGGATTMPTLARNSSTGSTASLNAADNDDPLNDIVSRVTAGMKNPSNSVNMLNNDETRASRALFTPTGKAAGNRFSLTQNSSFSTSSGGRGRAGLAGTADGQLEHVLRKYLEKQEEM
jgi:hypothetical protein